MKKALKGFVWVLLGILSAFVFAASAATGGFHPECFYDTGNVEDIYPFTLQQERPGLVYQNGADDFFTVTEDSVSVYLPVNLHALVNLSNDHTIYPLPPTAYWTLFCSAL